MESYDESELDDFFEQSPLFQEDRMQEKKELEIYNKRVSTLAKASFRCDRCKGYDIQLRRLIRSEVDYPVVYYCLNCGKIINY